MIDQPLDEHVLVPATASRRQALRSVVAAAVGAVVLVGLAGCGGEGEEDGGEESDD